jgi:hypothetical protein
VRWRKKYFRVVKRFALFPIKALIEDSTITYEWRWLEVVYLEQEIDYLFGMFRCWKNRAFITNEQYLFIKGEGK